MQKLQIKMDDITEEKISALINFLDTGELPEWMSESKMALLYGRIKARWDKIDKAEERLKPDYDRKKESYKWRILNDIKQWLEEYKNENIWSAHYEYEIANIKNWEWGRTMQLGFRDTDINDKLKRRKSILIEEKYNPEFFLEMLDKYAPKETFNPKPF